MKNMRSLAGKYLCGIVLAALSVKAQVVTFDFAGQLNNKQDAGGVLPESITSTSAFTGTLSYDIGLASDNAPADNTYGYYIYGTAGGLSINVSIGTNVFTSLKATNGSTGVFIIHDVPPGTPYDELLFEVTELRLNGELLPMANQGNIDVDLEDQASVALSTDVRPLVAPVLDAFPSLHRLDIYGGTNGTKVFSLSGPITSITPIDPPRLSITRGLAERLVLSWPEAAINYQLESSQTVTGLWSVVSPPFATNAGTISLIVPAAGDGIFYRLHKP